MKKSELRKIIKEEYQNIMREDEGSESTTQLKNTMLNDVTINNILGAIDPDGEVVIDSDDGMWYWEHNGEEEQGEFESYDEAALNFIASRISKGAQAYS